MITIRSSVIRRNICFVMALLLFSTLSARARKPHIMALTPPTPAQAALIDKAVANEKVMMKELQKRVPMVQTYIQNVKPDATLATVPVSDEYILSRVHFGNAFDKMPFEVTPILFRLTRYAEPSAASASAAAPGSTTDAAAIAAQTTRTSGNTVPLAHSQQ
jgi:hypothetical protein